MKKYWFRAKQYGYGWYPVTWQGWSVLVLYIVTLVSIFRGIDVGSHSGSDTLINFFSPWVILTGVLIWICAKTGERPMWRWAGKEVEPSVVLYKVILAFVVAFAIAFIFVAIKNLLRQP